MHYARTLLPLFSSIAFVLADLDQTCKCLPSDDCWPSEDTWAQLNATVSGRLLRPKPPASVCYPEEPNYDAEACKAVIKTWTSSAWHADDPISPSAPPSDACYPIYPNGTSTAGDPRAGGRGCDASSYPVYVINATSAEDVQAGINFARKHSVRLNVKNTGHGRSSIPGSLSIWTHYFREKTFHQSFQVEGNYNYTRPNGSLAITFGAGTMDREAFEFAAQHDVVVVGGTDGTVGLVGWGSAGGHGYLTGSYGMGADNFLQATVVTPEGEIVVANEYQNSDIFWAIRGGGGGTFGVLTSLTVNAYPMPTAVMWSLTAEPRNTTNISEWYELMSKLFAELPKLKESGLQGYITLGPATLTNAMFAYDQSKEHVEESISSVMKIFNAKNSSIKIDSTITAFPKWIDVYHVFNLTESVAGGSGSTTASRLLPAQALTGSDDVFAKFLEKAVPTESGLANNASTGRRIAATMASPSRHYDNSLNPAWRNATLHLLVQESWAADTAGRDSDELKEAMSDVAYNLRELAPGSGAYINERGDFVTDWQKTLYGENYARLLAIKHKYDPTSVQWCEGCVASDEWYERVDGRFCKQPWA